MKLEKLQKQLVREIRRSPQKALLLAGVSVVAIWFWAPLVGQWLAPKAKSPAIVAGGVAAVVGGAELPPAPAAADTTTSWRWSELVASREADPRTAPGQLTAESRDLFRPVAGAHEMLAEGGVGVNGEGEKAAQAPTPPPTPSELGLTVKGILIGPRVRSVQISGRTYQEGAWVTAGATDDEPGDGPAVSTTDAAATDAATTAFLVRRIEARHVVLERDGEEFVLRLAPDRGSGRVQVSARGG